WPASWSRRMVSTCVRWPTWRDAAVGSKPQYRLTGPSARALPSASRPVVCTTSPRQASSSRTECIDQFLSVGTWGAGTWRPTFSIPSLGCGARHGHRGRAPEGDGPGPEPPETRGRASGWPQPCGLRSSAVAGEAAQGRDGRLRGLLLLRHAHGRGAALGVAGGDRAVDRQHGADGAVEMLGDRGQLLVGEIPQLLVLLLGDPHAGPRDLVRAAERHPTAHQVIGDVRGEREALRGE